ncbi:alpha/beta fold hydrolase [Microtetraspora niveoalba]|uniref:alpha/beta fold hydrolase n=1 Tax=Microtetraspora niveoalba TaxID=46175 RepID=UPI0008372B23|nr:alpha/beta fold hydrolase [Microtetraspora niveoalba]
MTTYVLVPGLWLGAWAWQGVASSLRASGHTVHPLTLTGLADRSHLASPELTLDTHADDIVNLIRYEDLRDVVLVGHSLGGAAVTAAADRVPDRIGRVVYLDGGPVPDGVAPIEMSGREFVEARSDGWRYPFPSWEDLEASGASLEGLGPAERELMRARATAHPLGTINEPIRLTGAFDRLPKTLVSSSFPLDQVRALIAQGHPLFAALAGPEWELREVPTGHWPMFSRPVDTAAVLAEITPGG